MEGRRGPIAIIACKSGKRFAEKVLIELNNYLIESGMRDIELLDSEEIQFANSEIKTIINDSIRGKDVYIIQDVENSTNDLSIDQNLRALKTAIDAARRADAHYITAVLPVFPYARQDKQIGRECITAVQVAEEIENAGADRVLTLDIHNTAIAGFFRKAKFENLRASKNILDYVRQNICLDNLVVVAPDEGGTKRASYYAQVLKTKLAIVYKKRDYGKTSEVESTTLLGNVEGKDILIIDDMISTGGTLCSISKMLKREFGVNEIYLACSLPLFNSPAIERLNELFSNRIIQQVIGTDAVSHGPELGTNNLWYKELSVAKYFAKVIYNINNCISLSALLK
jgi:ribose-phosphate pyrophosphokinase